MHKFELGNINIINEWGINATWHQAYYLNDSYCKSSSWLNYFRFT